MRGILNSVMIVCWNGLKILQVDEHMEPKILIIEDDAAIAEMIGFALQKEHFQFEIAPTTHQARGLLTRWQPDLILLDRMLPGQSGDDFARLLKRHKEGRDCPIIMLTALAEERDVLSGFETGVDDYVTKPFSPKELIARIRAVLRRSQQDFEEEVLRAGGLTLDPTSHRVSAQNQEVQLGPTEYKLLHFFMSHPERVYSRTSLIDQVWGQNIYIEERTVDVHIRRLREALTETGCNDLVQTVRGAGYRFSTRV